MGPRSLHSVRLVARRCDFLRARPSSRTPRPPLSRLCLSSRGISRPLESISNRAPTRTEASKAAGANLKGPNGRSKQGPPRQRRKRHKLTLRNGIWLYVAARPHSNACRAWKPNALIVGLRWQAWMAQGAINRGLPPVSRLKTHPNASIGPGLRFRLSGSDEPRAVRSKNTSQRRGPQLLLRMRDGP